MLQVKGHTNFTPHLITDDLRRTYRAIRSSPIVVSASWAFHCYAIRAEVSRGAFTVDSCKRYRQNGWYFEKSLLILIFQTLTTLARNGLRGKLAVVTSCDYVTEKVDWSYSMMDTPLNNQLAYFKLSKVTCAVVCLRKFTKCSLCGKL